MLPSSLAGRSSTSSATLTWSAQGFLAERAAGLAQRVGRNVLMSGPVAAAAWLITFSAAAVPMLQGQLAGPWWALPLLGALLAGAIPLATRVSVSVRWSWIPSTLTPRAAVWWAQLAALGVMAADGLMLVMFAAWTTTSPPPGAPGLGPLAAVGVSRQRDPDARPRLDGVGVSPPARTRAGVAEEPVTGHGPSGDRDGRHRRQQPEQGCG